MTGNIVSFDIGSAQIKLVWCAGGVCKAAVSAPVPDGLVRGGTIVSMDAMADLLRQLVKENNLPRSAGRSDPAGPAGIHPHHRAAPHDRRPADV